MEVVPVEISDMLRKAARKMLRKHSEKDNERVGEWELSLMAVAQRLGLQSISWEIRSQDSDIQAFLS